MSAGTLLLVDDEQSFIDMLRLPLEAEGYTILEANSGARALEVYAAHLPDLVLLDVAMPGLSGFEVCRQLVALYGDACAPVIFYTAFTNPTDITRGFDMGGADYLSKPCSLNEIRARVRSHVQNHLLAKQQILLAAQLRRASAAKNRFLGMAAHDLRNPLVSIRGFSELLLEGSMGEMPARQRAVVTIIHDTAAMMLKNVNELLDAATLEAGELELQRERLNLAELTSKAVTHARIVAARRRVRLVVEPSPPSAACEGDADKINHVLERIFALAIKAAPLGGRVAVHLALLPETREISLTLHAGTTAASGPTPSSAFPVPVVESRVESTNEANPELVLVICRKIVAAHSGTLVATTEPDGGSLFRLLLPAAP